MGVLFNVMRGAGWAAAKATLGGGGRRIMTGALAGGIYGAATSQSNTGTGTFGDIIAGAAAGAGIGGLTTAFARRAVAPAARVGWSAAKTGMIGAMNAASFSLSNPRTALGIGAAGLGLYGLAQSGLGESGMNTNAMSRIAQMSGVPSTGFMPGMGAARQQEARAMFMNSTIGLSQGLHSRRHGG